MVLFCLLDQTGCCTLSLFHFDNVEQGIYLLVGERHLGA